MLLVTLSPVKITIRTPGTSANLGPGFDCLGLALDIWATVTVETVNTKRNGPSISRLVEQGIESVFEGIGKAPPVSVDWDGTIPLARGLGASAALRAAGLLAGNALLDNVHDIETLLALGTKLEGHPDNMAPALFGGLQVIVRAGDRLIHLGAPLPPELQVVVFVPDFEMPTQESRRRLPKQLPREDVVYNVSRAALLVTALGASRFDLLDEATQDRIHQPVRSEIFTGLNPIMTAAKQAGAVASYLSGGGSTVAAFVTDNAERVSRLMTQTAIAHGFSGRSIITKPTGQGASLSDG
ncbi:MAG: homoserine kinase [Dehalococcoidia bacterium]|nr:homoserine kinase [Dehalococcoidia bacterium]